MCWLGERAWTTHQNWRLHVRREGGPRRRRHLGRCTYTRLSHLAHTPLEAPCVQRCTYREQDVAGRLLCLRCCLVFLVQDVASGAVLCQRVKRDVHVSRCAGVSAKGAIECLSANVAALRSSRACSCNTQIQDQQPVRLFPERTQEFVSTTTCSAAL